MVAERILANEQTIWLDAATRNAIQDVLTDAGADLAPVLRSLAEWGQLHAAPAPRGAQLPLVPGRHGTCPARTGGAPSHEMRP
jgi:hypothetical protein